MRSKSEAREKVEVMASEKSGKAQQLLATLIVNLLSISSGIGCGWPSPVIPQLRSKTPPVGDTPMTEDQISWLNTLLPIGALIVIPFCGILSERLGRKRFAQLTGLPHVISWSFIVFGRNHFCLYAARLCIGVSCAMTIFISPIYVSEVVGEDVRGVLGSLMPFAANAGILIAYVAGAFLSYRLFACVGLFFPIVYLVAFSFMPDTPAYHIRRNRPSEARKSLMFFRGGNQPLIDQEMSRLQSQVDTSEHASRSMGWRDFFSDRATRMGLIISFILLGGQQLSGILAMLSYAETIFGRAGSTISPETAPIIIALIQIVGSYISTMLMERAGRRMLTLISCMGMAMSHVLLGLFFSLQRHDHNVTSITWLPLAAFSAYMAFYCLGIGPVPFVFPSEVFRLDVSSSASTLCYIFYWTMSSTAVRAFGPGMDLLGLDACFFILASFCVICFVCSYWLMPETKGRRLEDIVDELAGNDRSHRVKNEFA